MMDVSSEFLAVLPEMRRNAAARMGAVNGGSDAIVRRVTGEGPIPGTEFYGPVFTTLHESLPCRIATVASLGPTRTVTVPGGVVALATRRVDFPHGTPHFRDGDVIEIAAGANAGTSWLVIEADAADQQTAYRVPVIAYS